MAGRKFAKINHVISYDELKYYDCTLRYHLNVQRVNIQASLI